MFKFTREEVNGMCAEVFAILCAVEASEADLSPTWTTSAGGGSDADDN